MLRNFFIQRRCIHFGEDREKRASMVSAKKTFGAQHDEQSAEYRRGMEEIHKQLGSMADSYIRKIKALSPEFAWVNVTFPFGELYTSDVVDLKTRELCTVAALTVQGFSLPELKIHVKAALRCGASREEVLGVITQMIAYCGFPAATNALMTAKEALDEVDGAPRKPNARAKAKAKR
jgi:4-carboxymuconolactone decarboxylase